MLGYDRWETCKMINSEREAKFMNNLSLPSVTIAFSSTSGQIYSVSSYVIGIKLDHLFCQRNIIFRVGEVDVKYLLTQSGGCGQS